MKKIYWQPHGLPRFIMILMCIFSLIMLGGVEYFKRLVPQNYYNEKLAAATLTAQAMSVIKAERIRKKIPIDPETDPQRSGLIGEAVTTATSEHGELSAKQTSINPNVAALVVDWLKKIGVKRGDAVAIGLTGSFPGLNIAVLAAVQTLGLQPIIIASAASSQWGANIPGLLWLDMEAVLYQQKMISYMPIAASLGGIEDRARGMSSAGKKTLSNTIKHYQIPFLDSKDAVDGINKRMQLFDQQALRTPIKAYINIGGGTASIGKRHQTKQHFKPGLNLSMPVAIAANDSVMGRFMKRGIPVINLSEMNQIARKYDLPLAPGIKPVIGQGKVFFHEQYNPYLAAGALILILIFLITLSSLGKQLFLTRNSNIMEPPEV